MTTGNSLNLIILFSTFLLSVEDNSLLLTWQQCFLRIIYIPTVETLLALVNVDLHN